MNLVPCMGGWCLQRDKCAHYNAPPMVWRAPVERLCERGRDEPTSLKQAQTPSASPVDKVCA